jgi:hypothetical protein
MSYNPAWQPASLPQFTSHAGIRLRYRHGGARLVVAAAVIWCLGLFALHEACQTSHPLRWPGWVDLSVEVASYYWFSCGTAMVAMSGSALAVAVFRHMRPQPLVLGGGWIEVPRWMPGACPRRVSLDSVRAVDLIDDGDSPRLEVRTSTGRAYIRLHQMTPPDRTLLIQWLSSRGLLTLPTRGPK